MKKQYLHILVLGISLMLLGSCSKTKDTFTSRFYHGMVSKYNPLFNGEQALLKAETTLKKQHKDNFDEILPVFRFGDEQLASNVKPDLERAIEKGAKVIQTHSMLIRNVQRNKYIDDCYLLIGKARFYDRDYLKALETFNVIILEYPTGESLTEAKMWVARCKTELNNFLTAKEDFENIYREKDTPKKLKAEIFASYAQLEINQRRYTAAYQLLRQAIDKGGTKEQRVRWLFICGQLQSRMGNDFEASEIFRQVIRKGPPYELLFQAQLNRARNFDPELHDRSKAYDELEDMLRDDKNFDNRDQIYYAMAEIAEKLEEEEQMEIFLKKSIKVSTHNNRQKALSYLKLAETNFFKREYIIAEAYFDSTFKSMDSKDPRYDMIKGRKESLNRLVKSLAVIDTQDSLQKLANMSEEERDEFLEDYIQDLKDADAAAAEEAANQQFFNTLNQDNSPTGGVGGPGIPGAAAQWYFYNPRLRGEGVRDFTNKFGNRKLEDNWRRKNKTSDADFTVVSQEKLEEQQGVDDNSENDEKYAKENFLKDIPLSPEAMEESNGKIIEAYQDVGRIYKDELEDLTAAAKSLEELLGRFAQFKDEVRVWYTLYRIYLKKEDQTKADYYKNLILKGAPESEYAALVNNEVIESVSASEAEAKESYTLAYTDYEEGNYKSAFKQADEGVIKFAETTFLRKFHLLKAFCFGRLGKKEDLITTLKLISDLYGEAEEAVEARAILSQIAPEEETTSASESENEGKKSIYSLKLNSEHKYIVIVPNDGRMVNQLKIKLSDFGQKFFPRENLNTKNLLMGREKQVIIVSNFKESKQALDFYNNVVNQNILDEYLSAPEKEHFVISSDNFPKLYQSQTVGDYMDFFEKNYLKK